MTLCAWCGKQIIVETFMKRYNGEIICWDCYERREKVEDWQKNLDRWLTTPPDDVESKCKCSECGEQLFPDDEYYFLDGSVYCPGCAEEWLDQQKNTVSENMAYGD